MFSDHVGDNDENNEGEADGDGTSETSDIDVSDKAEKAKSEEGKESDPARKLLKKAASEERKGSAEGSAKAPKSQYPQKLRQNELITRQEMALQRKFLNINRWNCVSRP